MHLGSTGKQSADLADSMSAALRHHQREEFEAARRGYRMMLEYGWVDAILTYLMACLEIHLGNFTSATAWFCQGIRDDIGTEMVPSSADVHIPSAFNAALSHDPQPGKVCRQLEAHLPKEGDKLLPALVALNAWLKVAPRDTKALVNFADVADQMGDHSLAAARLRQVHRLQPANTLIPLKLGNALNAQGRPRQALAAYREAIRIDRRMGEAHANMALTLHWIGKTSAAEECLRDFLARNPRCPEVLFTLAELLLQVGRPEEAVKYYTITVEVAPAHVDAWFHQARAWKRMGLTRKAALAFRRAAALAPDRSEILFELGATLHGLKDFKGAEAALARTVALQPDDPSARYLLSAVRQENVFYAPDAYVEALFNRYAASFDRHMKGLLQYRIPFYLRKSLKLSAKQRGGFHRLLDLGCGTGLAGEALRGIARHMTGVDIAGRILKRAAQKKIYDQLVHDDFRHYLSTIEADYDLIVAADVFIYTGDLDAVFALIRKRLSRDGRLAFSIEKDPGGHFHLQRSGRFAHSHDYIVQLAEKHGFVIETARHVPVRMENSHWIDGALYIMRLA